MIAQRPFVAWAGQASFDSNHALIRWVRDLLGKHGPSRGRKPRSLAWLILVSNERPATAKTWIERAGLSAADIRNSPQQLSPDWQPPD
jgi:hypothetical protein